MKNYNHLNFPEIIKFIRMNFLTKFDIITYIVLGFISLIFCLFIIFGYILSKKSKKISE
jgi:hypothetical protein